MKPNIRPAEDYELRTLGRIELEAARVFPSDRIPQPPRSLPLEVLQTAQKDQLLWVIDISSKVVAFASCHDAFPYLHLDEISVLPEQGKQGLGTELLKYVIETAQERDYQACTLTTFEDFAWNAPFYSKQGFHQLAEKKLPRHLKKILKEEKSLGLRNRVAMSKNLD